MNNENIENLAKRLQAEIDSLEDDSLTSKKDILNIITKCFSDVIEYQKLKEDKSYFRMLDGLIRLQSKQNKPENIIGSTSSIDNKKLPEHLMHLKNVKENFSDGSEDILKEIPEEEIEKYKEDILALKELENKLPNNDSFSVNDYLQLLNFDEMKNVQCKIKRAIKLDFDKAILNRSKTIIIDPVGKIMRRHTG